MINHRFGAYFISGVDTCSGKTFVTARMAAYLHHRGVSVITQKPIQTGCATAAADDLVEHRKVMGTGIMPEDKEGRTCSYLFRKSAPPHLAAKFEGVAIDPEKIDRDTRYLLDRYSVVLIEGDGGLMVPLNDDMLTIEYIASRRLPLILVTTSEVGGINQALLSIDACKNHNIDLTTIVYNRLPNSDALIANDAFDVIKKFALSQYPHVQMVDFRSSDSFWDIEL